MKKSLLSLFSFTVVALGALAETATFDFTGSEAYDMTLLSGSTTEYNPQTYVCQEGNVTLTLNGSTRWWNASGKNQLRFYSGSSMTIAVADSMHLTSITLDCYNASNFEGDGYANGTWTGSKENATIKCNISKGNSAVYKIVVDYSTGEGTGEVGGNEGNDSTTTSTYGKYNAVSVIKDGQYLIYSTELIATPLAESYNYGYLKTVSATVEDNAIITEKANAFTITSTEGGYTIQDSYGRYIYQTGTYNSFNVSATLPEEGAIWTITAADTDATPAQFYITNTSVDKTIQYDSQYGSYGSYSDMRGALPSLFVYSGDVTSETPEEPETPDTPEPQPVLTKYVAQTTMSEGNYVLYVSSDTISSIAVPLAESKKYGYIYTIATTMADGLLETESVNAFTFTATEGGYTIQDSYGRYLYQTGTYNSFNLSDTIPAAGAVWTVMPYDAEVSPVTFAITNVSVEKTIQYDPTYNSFGSYPDSRGLYVSLFKESGNITDGVNDIAVPNNSPAIYYNLQGAKIANPTPGTIVIKVQGNKATKVLIK